jgi:hypothetical protein
MNPTRLLDSALWEFETFRAGCRGQPSSYIHYGENLIETGNVLLYEGRIYARHYISDLSTIYVQAYMIRYSGGSKDQGTS